MNVLQVNTVYPNGSTGRIAAEIAEYTAAQQDAHAFIACGIGEPQQRERLTAIRIGNPLERKLHSAIRKLFDAEGYGSRFATGRLIRFCETNHVDVIHMHNLHGCYINLGRWFRYLQRANIPVIWTLHDCWPFTGHCAYFDYCGCERWKRQCRNCPQKASYPACIGIGGSKRNYWQKKKLFTGVKNMTIVTPCRWLQGILGKSFLKGLPSRVIYNGVDLERFMPVESDIREQYGLKDKRVLLSVASEWTDRKGMPALLTMAELLDDTYRIVIIGLTREQINTLPENILGLERTASSDDLRAWYSTADCFVNPTLEDNMPLVNLEALACGTPIVVFNTGGCPEAVTEGCGYVVKKGEAGALAESVKAVCESGTDYSQACIAQAQRFSKETMVRAYWEAYREVLE